MNPSSHLGEALLVSILNVILCNGPAILFLKGNLSSFTAQDISNCNMEAIQSLNAVPLLLYSFKWKL